VIGRLRGHVAGRGPGFVLIDVGGVGYEVFCSERTLAALPGPGAAVAIHTELVVREDLMQLYGFATPSARAWHRLLTGVQGVGPRAALAIQGALDEAAMGRAIALGDWASLRAAPGVGPKLAQRIVNELKDKAPEAMALIDDGGSGAPVPGAPAEAAGPGGIEPPAPAPPAAPGAGAARAEALSALGHLGYGPAEAARAVAEAEAEGEAGDTPALIRAALRRLAPGGIG
jgi:Holliday junction DNA helicase RuvA